MMEQRVHPSTRRDLILDAAVQLFHERGYHATSVDDIGEAVSVSGPAIYRHFASKEDILVEAIRKAGDEIQVVNRSARSEITDPGTLMTRYVAAFVRVAIERAPLITVWISEVRHLTPTRRSPMTRRIRSWTDEWEHLLMECRPALSRTDARLLVAGAIGLITTVAAAVESDRDTEAKLTAAAMAALDAPLRSTVP